MNEFESALRDLINVADAHAHPDRISFNGNYAALDLRSSGTGPTVSGRVAAEEFDRVCDGSPDSDETRQRAGPSAAALNGPRMRDRASGGHVEF